MVASDPDQDFILPLYDIVKLLNMPVAGVSDAVGWVVALLYVRDSVRVNCLEELVLVFFRWHDLSGYFFLSSLDLEILVPSRLWLRLRVAVGLRELRVRQSGV